MTHHDQLATEYAANLPGLGQALLNDCGITNPVSDRHQIGWEGEHFTVPIVGRSGVSFFERWAPERVGVAIGDSPMVMLWNQSILARPPDVVVFSEGVLEALVLESVGLTVVAATGTGRFFKTREWKPLLESIPEILIAMPSGDKRERRKYLLSRDEVRWKIKSSMHQARTILWPSNYKPGDGIHRFFVDEKRSAEEFLTLPRQ